MQWGEPISNETRHLIVSAAKIARQQVRSEENNWIFHKCTRNPGCIKRMAVVDAGDKISRPRCSHPRYFTKLVHPYFRINRVYGCCMSTPLIGNQYSDKNRRCSTHQWFNKFVKQHPDTEPSDFGLWAVENMLDYNSQTDEYKIRWQGWEKPT